VLVRDLFHNTPARRKFLRSAGTELGHISEQLARVALPNPAVAFRLMHNGREVTNLPPVEDTAQRVRDLLGDELADALLPLSPRDGVVSVRGFAARPVAARSSAKWQYVFLNGRYVRDRLLSHAVREAYRGRLDPSRSPVVVVFLEIAPDDVDVNVHPTKTEVRFRDGQSVHSALLAALKDTLNRADLRPHAGASVEPDALDETTGADSPAAGPDKPHHADRAESLRAAMADFFKSVPPSQPRFEFAPRQAGGGGDAPPGRSSGTYHAHTTGGAHRLAARPEASGVEVADRPDAAPPSPAPASRPVRQADDPAHGAALAPPGPPALQVHDAYLVTQTDEGMMIVDQHALHERILYNDFRRRLEADPLEAQRMLIPPTLRVTRAESGLLERHAELLGSLGIEVEPFGPESVAIQRFPVLLIDRGVEPAAMLRELLDRLDDEAPTDSEQVLEAVLAMMACKAAVKAGDPLSPEEIAELLERARGQDKASACPHGRPTSIHLTLAELAREFHRT
jgi:DNA mismatch repair protein MutL